MNDRYFLLYTINYKMNFNNLVLMDKKLRRIYCGSPIGDDSISIREYGNNINRDKKIPINKRLFYEIRKESFIEWKKNNYLDFFKKYNLEEWLI